MIIRIMSNRDSYEYTYHTFFLCRNIDLHSQTSVFDIPSVLPERNIATISDETRTNEISASLFSAIGLIYRSTFLAMSYAYWNGTLRHA